MNPPQPTDGCLGNHDQHRLASRNRRGPRRGGSDAALDPAWHTCTLLRRRDWFGVRGIAHFEYEGISSIFDIVLPERLVYTAIRRGDPYQ